MLTATEIRAVKPQDKPRKLSDGGGLYLLANPNGSLWWRFKYRFEGREKLLSLGVFPYVSLQQARMQRDEAKKAVANGVDPSINDRRKNRLRRTRLKRSLVNGWDSRKRNWRQAPIPRR